jgi:hypothetical protein
MRWIALASILIATSLGTVRAADSETTVVGALDFGFKTLHLDTGSAGNVLNPSYASINPSVALGYQSFYASLSYDRSLGADPSTGQTMVSGTPTATLVNFSRTDSTFTLGYRLGDFSLFAGYTKGANHFTQTTSFIVQFATDIDYTETGPFAGFAYTKTFRDKSSLGFSVGYAKLDGELRTFTRPTNTLSEVKGDNTGLSYGLTWSGSLTGSLGYRVGVKATRYEMKDPGNITERYTNIFVGITNYF